MVLVVNIIPATWSDDINQDSEPGLSINPANPSEMVATAFTLDNPAGEPMVGPLAPTFYSNDGGQTWTLSKIVPSSVSSSWPTGDITIRYGGLSGVLYAGILTPSTDLNILRSPDIMTPMTKLLYHSGDQPYTQATTVLHGGGRGNDRVYVPFNDSAYPGLIFSLDAATAPAPAGFDQNYVNLNARPGTCGIPVRVAIHASGVIYGAFYHGSSQKSKVVVVCDDNWGKGNPPFAALTDPGDMMAGKIVAKDFPISGGVMGQQRVEGSMSIAVDPNDSERVYIAYATATSAADYTLHVACTSDGGGTWLSDVRVVPTATNPGLAINTLGQVGFLYQQLVPSGGGSNWVTRFERSSDDFTSPPETFVLANTPSETPIDMLSGVYLGDYLHLQAIGKDFCGIFCANNTPDVNNFPSGVIYQRNHHFPSKKLRGIDGKTEIPPSIDPFFFQVEAVSAPDDFYVRDWTESAASHDIGVEPSTNPVFYESSDVWNQVDGSAPVIQADDTPAHQLPQPGDNFAFVRVSRRAAPDPGSPPVTVTAQFLYADFGLGTTYQDISASPLGQVGFAASDSSPKALANGVKWQLPASHSPHICLAVQISTPADPFALAPGGLLGHAPGWPTTDLLVINDNNKAQRNIDFPMMLAAPAPEITFYVLIENAATYRRDMAVRCEAPQEVLRKLKGMSVGEAGTRRKRFRSGDIITFRGLEPGESRWLALTVRGVSATKRKPLPVRFHEMSGARILNGVSITVRPSPMAAVIRDNLQFHLAVMNRLEAIFGTEAAHQEAFHVQGMLERENIPAKDYISFFDLNVLYELIRIATGATREATGFRILPDRPFRRLKTSVSTGSARSAAAAHAALLHTLDALLTTHEKSQGDVADIPINVSWQADLYGRLDSRKFRLASSTIVSRSRSFMADYEGRRLASQDYPSFIRELLPAFRETAAQVARRERALRESISDIERSLNSPAALQRAHRRFLLRLQAYEPVLS
jgi:hypothetical protein